MTVLPGATIGILGSGQLGRMLTVEAKYMGYRVHTFSPGTDTPTGQVADGEVSAAYEDLDVVKAFAKEVDVVTLEFENIPVKTLEAVQEFAPVHPGVKALRVAQNRLREKTFLSEHGFPVVPFRAVRAEADVENALQEVGTPAVLKTAGFGYDGKGQAKVSSAEEGRRAFAELGQEAVLEAFIEFGREVSVVAARGLDGSFAHYGVIENGHENHILDLSFAPSDLSQKVADKAVEIARGVLEALDVVGVMCVEFFMTHDFELIVNEVAPRPHNSGHLTIEGCVTSQFGQQLRAVCGLPLGSTEFLRPVAMANLLGDVWQKGEPKWAKALALPDVHLHLYGKAEARAGRKMGHITALGKDTEEVATRAREARASLTR